MVPFPSKRAGRVSNPLPGTAPRPTLDSLGPVGPAGRLPPPVSHAWPCCLFFGGLPPVNTETARDPFPLKEHDVNQDPPERQVACSLVGGQLVLLKAKLKDSSAPNRFNIF